MPSNTPPSAETPALPPYEGMPPLNVSGSGHIFNFGGNAKTTSSVNQNIVSKEVSKAMEKHGPGYWLIHLFVAILATALFESGLWIYHLYHH